MGIRSKCLQRDGLMEDCDARNRVHVLQDLRAEDYYQSRNRFIGISLIYQTNASALLPA